MPVMNVKIVVWVLSCSLCLMGCTGSEAAYAINSSDEAVVTTKPVVQTKPIVEIPFSVEIYSKGIVEAYRKVTVKFQREGMISMLSVTSGDFVKEGAIIAQQETQQLDIEQEQLELSIAKAKLDFEDLLLKMGYNVNDSIVIPEQILEMARIRSGLREYEIGKLKLAEKYRLSRLVAPFSGYLAEVEAQANNLSSSYQKVGVLMDLNRIWVSFKILEEEMSLVEKGDQVEIIPFGKQGHSITGILAEINPMVDKNGLISVKALVNDNHAKLVEGVHTDVRIHKSVGKQIAVPKSAVLDRNGKDVVFLHKEGKAYWTYVDRLFENQDSVCISSGLSVGDELIVDGHINLAHQAAIRVDSVAHSSFN